MMNVIHSPVLFSVAVRELVKLYWLLDKPNIVAGSYDRYFCVAEKIEICYVRNNMALQHFEMVVRSISVNINFIVILNVYR